MKTLLFFALFVAVAMAGCQSTRLPPAITAISVESFSSPWVATMRPKLAMEENHLVLSGAVYPKYGAKTTTQTHIDVTFLDPRGQELRYERLAFAPNDLLYRPKGVPNQGRYRLLIEAMPEGTVRIEIRAHDGPHMPGGAQSTPPDPS